LLKTAQGSVNETDACESPKDRPPTGWFSTAAEWKDIIHRIDNKRTIWVSSFLFKVLIFRNQKYGIICKSKKNHWEIFMFYRERFRENLFWGNYPVAAGFLWLQVPGKLLSTLYKK
jgi:hypothetical protein